jgi:hypothetical protein
MAGSILVSSVTLDSDNTFSILSNTGTTLFQTSPTGVPQIYLANGVFTMSGQQIAVNSISYGGYKILGQIATTANSISNVYVVPSTSYTSLNSITVCNGTPNAVVFDLVVRPTTEALATKHYLIKGVTIPAADTLILEPGITLPANAILAANTNGGNAATSAAGVSVHAYGVELV